MPIRILIADDHELIRQGLKAVFARESKIEVVGEAVNGLVAVAKTIECHPDIVLMDIRMPLMDGCEATRQIKISAPNSKVLILTSNDSNLDMFAALAAGAEGYCLKTTEVKELVLAIETVHAGASWLDPQIAQLVLRSARGGVPERSGIGAMADANQSFGLSAREIEVLGLLVEGLSNMEIAKKLIISHETVKTHMRHIMSKLQVSDRTKAALKAIRAGISSI